MAQRLPLLVGAAESDGKSRVFLFLGLSGLAFLFSLTLPIQNAQPMGFGLAAGLLAAAGLFGAQWVFQNYGKVRSVKLAESDIHDLEEPAFVTDTCGRILSGNRAAAGFALPGLGGPISSLFENEIADPEAIISQLLSLTAQAGGARRELASNRVLRVFERDKGVLVWVISEPQNASEESPLPELRLSADRAVLSVNTAAQVFFGQDDGEGSASLPDVPFRNGQTISVETSRGPQRVTLVVASEPEGVQRITLVPETRADAPEGNVTPARPDLLNTLPVPMLKIATDGHLIEANSEARAIFGLKSSELPPLFELVEGMGRPIADWLADAAEGNGLLKPEIARAVIPGQELFLQIALGRMIEDGEVVLVGILNDATELKTLEAQFVQSQKMQAIGQLAGGVAHDFNNLLTAISGHCDLLLLRHDAGDPEYSDLIQISQNANRAASLVGQLLAFSRKQNLKPQSIDIRDTMSDLAHLLNRLIGEKVQLDVRHAPGPQVIRADRRQLEQVIVNLVVNARDAMPDGGTISVRSHPEFLEEGSERDRARLTPGAYVVIEVEDTGVGISPEVLSKIFEPFYTTKKTGEGTGLGLSTAYGIVKQTGGFIFCDSELGRGTKFTLYFRASQKVEAEVQVEAPKEDRAAPGDGVVLLVEDEAPVRAFAARALRLRGYTVVEADCAEEALEILENPEMKIDIFVSDVIMPGEDGPTWVKKAREARPDVPVIFMSGYAEESRAENQARITNSSFLPKPFSLQQLTNIVQEKLQ